MNMCSKPPEMGASLGEDRGLSVIPSCIVYRRRCHWQSVGWLLAGQFLTEASASEDIRRLWFFTVNISLTTPSRCWEQFLTSTCWAIELKTSFISLNGSVWWCFKRQFNLSVNWSQELNCLSIFSFNYFTCSSQCVVMSFGKNVKGGLSSFVAALLPPQVTRFFFFVFFHEEIPVLTVWAHKKHWHLKKQHHLVAKQAEGVSGLSLYRNPCPTMIWWYIRFVEVTLSFQCPTQSFLYKVLSCVLVRVLHNVRQCWSNFFNLQ